MPGGSESSGWCSGGEGSLEEPDDAFTAVLDSLAAENHQLKRQLADACERVAKTNKVTYHSPACCDFALPYALFKPPNVQ